MCGSGMDGWLPSEQQMFQVAEKLPFDTIPGIDGPKSQRPDVALLELEAAETILWSGGLEMYLNGLFEKFPPFGGALSEKEKERVFEGVVFDDTNVRLSKFLLRRTLDDVKVSLADLAERVYSRQSQNFQNNRKRMRHRVVSPHEDLWIWAVEEIVGKDRNGGKRIVRYRLSAAKSLLFFYEHIYTPRRNEQIRRYMDIVNRHGKENQ